MSDDQTYDENSFLFQVFQFFTALACIACFFVVVCIFIYPPVSAAKETVALSGVCVAVSAVLSVMPLQLAPVLFEKGSESFVKLVAQGMHMCFGSLCFVAATLLKYATSLLQEPSDKLAINVLTFGSTCLFIVAAISTILGFYGFTILLALECLFKKKKSDT